MSAKIQLRRGNTAAWTGANPILGAGEPGYDTQSKVLKIGDGVNNWSVLTPITAGNIPAFTAAGTAMATAVDANAQLALLPVQNSYALKNGGNVEPESFRLGAEITKQIISVNKWFSQMIFANESTTEIVATSIPLYENGAAVSMPDGCVALNAGNSAMTNSPDELPLPALATSYYIPPLVPTGTRVSEPKISEVLSRFVLGGLWNGTFDGNNLSNNGDRIVCDPTIPDRLIARGWTVNLPGHPSFNGYVGVPADGTRSIRAAIEIEYFRSDVNGTPQVDGQYISAWHEGFATYYTAIIDFSDPNIMLYPEAPTGNTSLIPGYDIYVMNYTYNSGMSTMPIIFTYTTV